MSKCPNNCGNSATIDPTYGVIPCISCRKKNHAKPKTTVEFTTEEIKNQRRHYKDDILQPFYKGELSKEYIQKYGTKRLGIKPEEVKKATYVYNGTDMTYYNS